MSEKGKKTPKSIFLITALAAFFALFLTVFITGIIVGESGPAPTQDVSASSDFVVEPTGKIDQSTENEPPASETTATENSETDQNIREPRILKREDALALANKYGEMYGVDPLLIMAIIRVESTFDANALSSSDAIGLMQIKMTTFSDIYTKIGASYREASLYDPETNVKAGAYYLSWLGSQFGKTTETVVAYYYGVGNVRRLLQSAEYSSDGKTLIYEKIPDAARRYLDRVMNAYDGYIKGEI